TPDWAAAGADVAASVAGRANGRPSSRAGTLSCVRRRLIMSASLGVPWAEPVSRFLPPPLSGPITDCACCGIGITTVAGQLALCVSATRGAGYGQGRKAGKCPDKRTRPLAAAGRYLKGHRHA